MPIIPPKDPDAKLENTSVSLSRGVLRHLDEVAKAEGLSRSRLINYCLEYALEHYELAKELGDPSADANERADRT